MKMKSNGEEGAAETEEFFVSGLERWRQAMGIEKFVLLGHSVLFHPTLLYATSPIHRPLRTFTLSAADGVGVELEVAWSLAGVDACWVSSWGLGWDWSRAAWVEAGWGVVDTL